MAAGADKFYPAGLGETSDARTHRSNFVRNGGIAKTNKKHHRFRHPPLTLGSVDSQVAQVVGVHQTVVGEKIREIAELQKSLKSVLASGIPHLEVAEHSPHMRLGETTIFADSGISCKFSPHAPGARRGAKNGAAGSLGLAARTRPPSPGRPAAVVFFTDQWVSRGYQLGRLPACQARNGVRSCQSACGLARAALCVCRSWQAACLRSGGSHAA